MDKIAALVQDAEVRGVLSALTDAGVIKVASAEAFEGLVGDVCDCLGDDDYDLSKVAAATDVVLDEYEKVAAGPLGIDLVRLGFKKGKMRKLKDSVISAFGGTPKELPRVKYLRLGGSLAGGAAGTAAAMALYNRYKGNDKTAGIANVFDPVKKAWKGYKPATRRRITSGGMAAAGGGAVGLHNYLVNNAREEGAKTAALSLKGIKGIPASLKKKWKKLDPETKFKILGGTMGVGSVATGAVAPMLYDKYKGEKTAGLRSFMKKLKNAVPFRSKDLTKKQKYMLGGIGAAGIAGGAAGTTLYNQHAARKAALLEALENGDL